MHIKMLYMVARTIDRGGLYWPMMIVAVMQFTFYIRSQLDQGIPVETDSGDDLQKCYPIHIINPITSG